MITKKTTLMLGALVSMASVSSAATMIRVTVTNNSPTNGVGLAPFWFGFHNGSFDSYDGGAASAPELERLAEVGNPDQLSTTFAANGTLVATGVTQTGTRVQGQSGILAPGATFTTTLMVADDGSNNYFSYASMILPSNDYYIANGSATAHDISSVLAGGMASEFTVGGVGTVNDAGTEINDFNFSAGNPFAPTTNQMANAPGGADQNGVNANVVGDPFAGFLNNPGNLDSALNFNDASIYTNGIATVRIEVAPEPSSAALLGLGGIAFALRRRRK